MARYSILRRALRVGSPGLALGSAALAVLAAGCGKGGTPPPFRPGASEGGYTTLYDPKGLPPHVSDGPCVQLSPNAGVEQAKKGIGQIDCTGSAYGFNVQETQLNGNRVAVWGILPAGATRVTVAHSPATVNGHTYLAVLPRPAGTYTVVARDRSGLPVATISSDQLPPAVPNVSS